MIRNFLSSKSAGLRGAIHPRFERRCQVEVMEGRLFLSADVLTYHNDNLRTGANLQETVLTPANVNKTDFGKLFTLPVDGQVYAQPLVESNVRVGGKGTHNIVFVATEHDSVYAFDADTGAQVWKRSFIDPAHGITTPTSEDVMSEDIGPEVGITGTPVIDRATGTLYVVTKVKKGTGSDPFKNFQISLHALDVTNGRDKFGGSVVVTATVPGAGSGQSADRENPTIDFDPLTENNRPGLLLLNGVVYLGFASHGDNDPYHGWLLGYDAHTLKQRTVFNASPNGLRAPIWQGGAAPASDGTSIYAAIGNGTYDVAVGGTDWGDSVLKLSQSLKVTDSFTPHDQNFLLAKDQDLGSDGVVLLPGNRLITGDKRGRFYVLNTKNLGGFSLSGDNAVQELNIVNGEKIYSTPAVFNNKIYFAALDDNLKALNLLNGKFQTTPASTSKEQFGYPGATPSVSANGSTNGIVWAIERRATSPDQGGSPGTAVLHAYDANNLSHELYSADQNASRDIAQGPIKFGVPTIANGHVFIGTNNALVVYGLIPTVTRVALVNSDTGQAIKGYVNLKSGTTIDLHTLTTRRLSLIAYTSPATVGSVRFGLDKNSTYGTDNVAPFSLPSTDQRHLIAWTPTVGSHTITITPYTQANGKGLKGFSLTITIKVKDSAHAS